MPIMGLGWEAHTVGERESACKPGSVESNHSSGTRVTASLERPTRKRARIALRAPVSRPRGFPIWPCSRWGLPCRRVLPPARCALTAPFHPYRSLARRRRFAFCCTVRGLAPPRRYLAPHPPEPGLSSTLAECENSDCPADSPRHDTSILRGLDLFRHAQRERVRIASPGADELRSKRSRASRRQFAHEQRHSSLQELCVNLLFHCSGALHDERDFPACKVGFALRAFEQTAD